MVLQALLLAVPLAFAGSSARQTPASATLYFLPASTAWERKLSPSFAGGLIEGVPPHIKADRLGVVSHYAEARGFTPDSFAALGEGPKRMLLEELVKQAKGGVDDQVWADIRRVSDTAPPEVLDRVVLRLDEALGSYEPFLSRDSRRAAKLARDFALARLKALETAKALEQDKPVALSDAKADFAVRSRLQKARFKARVGTSSSIAHRIYGPQPEAQGGAGRLARLALVVAALAAAAAAAAFLFS